MVRSCSLGALRCVVASCLVGSLGRRRAKGSGRGGPGSLATWEGEELRRCGRDALTGGGGGREATWVGFRPGSACPPPRVTSLPLSSFSPRHHVRRRRRGRAQCSRRAPTPPFWGAGAYRAEAGAFPHPGPSSLHPLQGSHPRGSQEGTRRHLSKETQLP